MVKRLRKRAISIVLMLTMVFTLFPTTAINAYAAEDNTEYSQLMDQQEDETVSESEDGFVSDENEEITDPEDLETEDSSEDLFDDDIEAGEEDLIDEEIPEEELIEEGSSKLLGLEPEMSLMGDATVNDITINSAEHGSVTANPTTAESDTTITLTAQPEAGYKLKSISAIPIISDNFTHTVGKTTCDGTYFKLTADKDGSSGWRVQKSRNRYLTISSTSESTNIDSVVLTSAFNLEGNIEVNQGTATVNVNGTTITINNINATSVKITSTEAEEISGATVYGTGEKLELTGTSDPNVYQFTMPDSAVSVSAEFEESPLIAQTVTAPTKATNLTYKKDEAQALLTEGAVVTDGNKTEGSVQYMVGTDGEWSTEIPTGTNAGVYKVYYKVEGNDTYAEYAPADPISVTIAKADPETPTGMTGKYGQTLSTVSLPGGWSWAEDDTIMNAGVGNYTYKANYNPTDATNYNSLSNVDLTVKVGKGDGTISFSKTEVESTIGVEPPSVYFESTGDGVVTFTSDNEDVATVDEDGDLTIIGVGETTITASVVDSDTYQYATKSVSYKLIVNKRSTKIKTVPTASEITYGQTLADSTLSGGEELGNIEGTFSWADSGIAPAVSDSETTKYAVKFTPKNSDIYAESTCNVKVKVNKAAAPATKESLLPEQKPAAKNADDLVYTGEPIELVTAPTADLPKGYKAFYSTDGETWSKDIPKKKDPGSYTVKVKYVSESGNYEDIQLDDISVTITVDKSILGNVIKEAKDYKDEITKKNTDDIYTTVISDLGTAISTAETANNNPSITDDDVVSAIDALTTALNKAKADVKDIDDQRAADAVITLIDELPVANDVTIEDKDDIEAARAAYNSLTGDQKNKVTNLEKLTNAEAAWVTAYRNAKKNAADGLVSDEDSEAAKALVTNAKNDIDNITYDQSKGLDVFKAAVDAIITKVTADVGDQRAADAVITQINALPVANEVTIEDKNQIEAARAAYNYFLTDGQKSKVTDETLKKLTDAEAALKDLVDAAEAKKVADKIDKLPSSDKVALTDKESIKAARKAYDALTDDQKAKVTPETLKKLTDAEDKLVILQVMSEVSAKTGSGMTYTGNPIQLINTPTTALPAGYTMKYAVTTENVEPKDENLYTTDIPTKTDAGTYYVWYKVKGDASHSDSTTACVSVTITDPAAIVSDMINALPVATAVKTTDKAVIEAARAAYNDLTNQEKDRVPEEVLKKLTDAEDALAAAAVSDMIGALPAAASVKTTDKDAIEAARGAYDKLTDAQKEYVSNDTINKLTDAEDGLKAATVAATIGSLPEADEVTTNDKAAIEAARAALEALTDAQKTYVPADALSKLEAVEAALVDAMIVALPAADKVTTADKDTIEAAREAYKALTDAQKKLVPEASLKKLAAVETALEIVLLPDAEAVETSDKEAIEAARAAYDALTDDQKKAVGADVLTRLEVVEAALVEKLIEALPSADKVTADDKSAVELARNKYEALSDEQKKLIGSDALAKLEAVEAALLIALLPSADKVTKNDKDAVLAARKAYNALTDEQKTQVGSAAEDKLKAVEVALTKALIAALPSASAVKSSDAEAVATAKNLYDSLTDDQKDQITVPEKNKLDAVVEAISDAEVYDVRTLINKLPAPGVVTESDEAAINAAREAYEKLSDAKKAFVGETSTGKLIADETVIAIIKLPAPDKVTLDYKDTIDAIREAYDSLTDAQKEEIGSDKAGKLEEAEAALKAIEDAAAANSVKDKIDALPASADVTVAHKGTIEEARAAYNALTDDQKKLITKETLDKLEEAESALAAAEAVYSVTSIKLRAVNGTTMIPGSSQEIEAAITPSTVSASQLIWSSDNENVATVTGEGKVEVKKDIVWGDEKSFDVKITAKSTNDVEGSVTITVKPEAEKAVTGITIDPKSVKTGLKPGDTFRLTAMITPADATDKTVTWKSSNDGIAKVGPTGIVTITGTGKATITVKKAGTDDSISAYVDLVIDKKDVTGITINSAGGDCLVVGSSAKLSANVTPSDATYQDVSWSSSDATVADVDEDGTVTAKAAGKVTITATSTDSDKAGISASKELVVFEDDDSLHVEFAEGSEYYYTGRAITPDVEVYYHGKPLLRDTDYKVSYKNNKNANDASKASKAPTVKVTGKTVAATAEATFKILPVDIGDEELVTAEELSVAYGKTATPLLYYGGTRLTGSDITNNHAKFKFTESRAITVYGKGNFTGEREIWVNVKSSAEIKSVPKIRVKSFTPAKRYYNGQEQPLNAKESAEDNDNEIVVVSAADKSKTPKELVLGKDFYIAYPKDITNVGTVRIAVIGMGDYTGTISKTYKILAAKDDTASIKGMDITFRDPDGNYTIGGNTYDYYEYQPGGVYPYVEVVANYQDERIETLVAGRDYKVTFANNKKAGEINENKLATATITFKGNYKSLKKQTKKFFITRADMSAAAVNLKNRIVTKANARYPISAPVVDVNEVTVKKSEYKVTYKVDGKEVNKNTKGTFKSGEPVTVTVEVRAKAKGNYTGTAIGEYTVTLSDSSKDLSKAKVIIQKKGDMSHKAVKNLKFTGGEIRIGEGEYEDYELYVYTGNSAKNPKAVLKEGTDYVATYSNNVKAGKATVVLNAVEGEEAAYFGSRTFTFKIVKGSMPWFK